MTDRSRARQRDNRDRVQRLIDAYVDGELADESTGELLAMVASSPDVRRRLARAVVMERLLTALGRGPVASADIMHAVRARGAARRPPRARPSAGRRARPALATAVLALLAGTLALLFGHHRRLATERPPPVPTATSTTQSPVSSGAAADGEAPPPAAASGRETAGGGPPAPPPVARPFTGGPPLALPPPPDGEDLTPPADDGAREPGFVPPPSRWPAVPPAADDERTPAPPVLWVKVLLRPDDPETPGDVRALMRRVRRELALEYGSAVRTMGELSDDPARNPVLYFSGHHHFTFTNAERRLLRKLILTGGMAIFNAALGSEPFYASARRELRMIFPDIPLQRLAPDHPLFHAYHDVDQVSYAPGVGTLQNAENDPWLDGLTISCRTAVVLSRWGLSAGWVGHAEPTFRTLAAEDARRIGVNLFAYATAVRAWTKQRARNASFVDIAAPDSSRLFVAQVMYDGAWRTRYNALAVLLHTFNRRTDVPVTLRTHALRLTDDDVFKAPLLYLTGHQPLTLSAEEIERLRAYVRSGGFLFAEACCGRRGFDRSFRALMKHAFPAHPLQKIPPDAQIFRVPNHIPRLGVTPSLAARTGSTLMAPRLEGARFGDQYGVVYSPYALAGGWDMSQMPYADGYKDPDAIKLGQNILMYAVTQ